MEEKTEPNSCLQLWAKFSVLPHPLAAELFRLLLLTKSLVFLSAIIHNETKILEKQRKKFYICVCNNSNYRTLNAIGFKIIINNVCN